MDVKCQNGKNANTVSAPSTTDRPTEPNHPTHPPTTHSPTSTRADPPRPTHRNTSRKRKRVEIGGRKRKIAKGKPINAPLMAVCHIMPLTRRDFLQVRRRSSHFPHMTQQTCKPRPASQPASRTSTIQPASHSFSRAHTSRPRPPTNQPHPSQLDSHASPVSQFAFHPTSHVAILPARPQPASHSSSHPSSQLATPTFPSLPANHAPKQITLQEEAGCEAGRD